MKGCPIGIDIPGFIRLLREGNVTAAYEKIKEQNPLPSICGRICSAPCELSCILTEEGAPIGIRALERYASDFGRTKPVKRSSIVGNSKKVAIVGSGPTGLSAAGELAKKGYQVTIFESLDRPGGVLRYGIPEFRIPKKILDQEIQDIKSLGVEIETNFYVGQTTTLEELSQKGFSAILLAMGAGLPKFMDLPGANLGGVYYGEEFLMRVNLTKSKIFNRVKADFFLGQKVAVIGSGNTALDCARTAKRLGREVTLIFRRTEDEMRVRKQEREWSKEEGIVFESLVKPMEIVAGQNNFVSGVRCIRMDYAETETSDQWELTAVPDSEFVLDVDTVVIAIGHRPNSLISRMVPNLKINEDGTIVVDEKNQTSISGVFASGNIVTNAGPVVEAIAAGKQAAENINRYLR